MVMDVTVSFIPNTALKDVTDLGRSLLFFFQINELMDTQVQPTNESLSAKQSPLPYDLDKVHESLSPHLKRNLKLSSYPIRRALPLVEESHWTVVLRILTSHRLAYTPYPTFESLLSQTTVGLGVEGGVGGGMDTEEEGDEVVKRKVDLLDLSVGQFFSSISLAVSLSKVSCGYHTQRTSRYG